MGKDRIVESRVRPDLAFRYDPCYSASTVETTDFRAIAVGLALLAVGFFFGRKSRQDPDALRVIDEMRSDANSLRGRVERAEEQSARTSRGVDALLALLPAEIRDRLARDRDDV